MAAKVPMIDMGNARLGIMVAETFRKKRKITRTTSATVRSSVNLTSLTESRMDSERSIRMPRFTEGGSNSRKDLSWFLMESTTWTVFVPGCFWTARMMERISDPPLLNHAADLSF